MFFNVFFYFTSIPFDIPSRQASFAKKIKAKKDCSDLDDPDSLSSMRLPSRFAFSSRWSEWPATLTLVAWSASSASCLTSCSRLGRLC